MIDVHCHYLPAVDDGARDLQTALAMIRRAHADGVRHLVLTPHVHAGRWDNPLSVLRPRFRAFRNLVDSKEIGVKLYLGGEVHLLPESLQWLAEGEIPFIGGWKGMKVMLLEFPHARIPQDAMSAVRHLLRQGVLPMLAHPERNRMVADRVSRLEPFVAEGCLMQLTAASVIGEFGQRAQQASKAIMARGWATVVASDAHDLRYRPTRMKAVYRYLKEHYGPDVARRLTLMAPARLLAGRAELGIDAE